MFYEVSPDDLKDLTPEQLDAYVKESLLNDVREHRNLLIQETDWMANSDVTMTDEWKTYRQQLRDITKTHKSMDGIVWPTKPS